MRYDLGWAWKALFAGHDKIPLIASGITTQLQQLSCYVCNLSTVSTSGFGKPIYKRNRRLYCGTPLLVLTVIFQAPLGEPRPVDS